MTNRICNLLIIAITRILCFLPNAIAADDDIIGSWVDENPNNPSTIAIYKENDKILYYRDFGEGTIWLGFLVN